jgi:DNA-binding NarL/FixJ family response regulator
MLRPDVLLPEQHLPHGLGTDSVAAMVKACPAVMVLMVTAHDGDDLLLRAITAGAARVVLKTNGMETLVKTIRARRARRGRHPRGRPAAGLPRAAQALRHDLTARERDILKLLALG